MSKEIESLKRIETTFSMNKQGKESVYREYTNSVYPYYEDFDLVLNALQRLESIDNSEPSEALKCLEDIYRNGVFISEVSFTKQHPTIRSPETNKTIGEQCDTIKQALLKAQEPKQYLKWEDLEFDDKEQRMDVSLNGHPHLLCYYRTLFGSLCMIDNTGITIREDNKYFFNDLHLERVEE